MDPQTELEGIVRRLSGLPELGLEDMSYEVADVEGGGCCATVLIAALGLISFAGEVAETPEDAMSSAAITGLAEFAAIGKLAARYFQPAVGRPMPPSQPPPGSQARKRVVKQEFFASGEEDELPFDDELEQGVPDPNGKRQRMGAPAAPEKPLPMGPALPVGVFRPPPGGFQQDLPISSQAVVPFNGHGPCSPLGRSTPLVRPSPHFQKQSTAGAGQANAKCQLNELLPKLLGRTLKKDDQVYDVIQDAAGGFSATLHLPELGNEKYMGMPCSKRKDAEHSAAAAALTVLVGRAPPPQGRTAAAKPRPRPSLPLAALALPGNRSPGAASPAASPRPTAQDDPELQMWQQVRLEPLDEDDRPDSQSLDLWYGQVCLLCLVVCPKCSWATHSAGQKHQKKFESLPVKKRPEVPRPPTEPTRELLPADLFKATAGWARQDARGNYGPVLIVGEMDFSFSLAVARLRKTGAHLVATSYLEAHDPTEPEVYPSDDGQRAAYRRRSLPGMNGALLKNLKELKALGAEVKHGVDATQLDQTLRSQGIEGAFQKVVFPFPRASLQRACDPRNSRLLRNFFLSVTQEGFVMEGGNVQLVMLSTQYEEWDVACMAAEAGFELDSRVQLPPDFYQSREMSGKPWTPQGAELLTFCAAELFEERAYVDAI